MTASEVVEDWGKDLDPVQRMTAIACVARDAGFAELERACLPLPRSARTMPQWVDVMRKRVSAYERAGEWFTLAESTALEIARILDAEG
jgi:hypothetical protein